MVSMRKLILFTIVSLVQTVAFAWPAEECKRLFIIEGMNPYSRMYYKYLDESPSEQTINKLRSRWAKFETYKKIYPWAKLIDITPSDPRFVGTQKAVRQINENRQSLSKTIRDYPTNGGYAETQTTRQAFENADRQILDWAKKGLTPTPLRIKKLVTLLREKQYNDTSDRTGIMGTEDHSIETFKPGHPWYFGLKLEDLEGGLKEFCLWYKVSKTKMRPMELAALAYARMVTIHVFSNGNGRTARLIMDWILELHGYPPASPFLELKDGMSPEAAPLMNAARRPKLDGSLSDYDVPLDQTLMTVTDAVENSYKIFKANLP